jgi:hypothetical protein
MQLNELLFNERSAAVCDGGLPAGAAERVLGVKVRQIPRGDAGSHPDEVGGVGIDVLKVEVVIGVLVHVLCTRSAASLHP